MKLLCYICSIIFVFSIVTECSGEKPISLIPRSDSDDLTVTPPTPVFQHYNWFQDAVAKGINTDDNDDFGYSINISGNYAVVSGRIEDNSNATIQNSDNSNSLDSGAFYIFSGMP